MSSPTPHGAPGHPCAPAGLLRHSPLCLRLNGSVLRGDARNQGSVRGCTAVSGDGRLWGFRAACGAGTVRAELAGLGAVLRRGWRCWWQEEALWVVLVWAAPCWQVLRLGALPGSPQLLPRSPVPGTLWRGVPSPVPPGTLACHLWSLLAVLVCAQGWGTLCQRGTRHLPLTSRWLGSVSAFI